MVIIFEISGVGLTLCNLVKGVQRYVFEMNALFYTIMDCKQKAKKQVFRLFDITTIHFLTTASSCI